MDIAIENNKLYSAMSFMAKGIRLPPVIPMENNIVSGTSFPALKILPAEEMRSGGIPEKPIPIIPAPIRIIILFPEKIPTNNPTMLITDRKINKVPPLILYDRKLISNLPASIPTQNIETINPAL